MAEPPTDVLVAGYQDIDTATEDFESLVARVRDKKVQIEGVILVTHDEAGNVSVRQTADHLGRTGGCRARCGAVRAADPACHSRHGRGRRRADGEARRSPSRDRDSRQDW